MLNLDIEQACATIDSVGEQLITVKTKGKEVPEHRSRQRVRRCTPQRKRVPTPIKPFKVHHAVLRGQ